MEQQADTLDVGVLTQLRESVGGDQQFVSDLIDEFLDDAPRQLQSLRAAAESGDREAARRAAHTLKGNARTFGARELATTCHEMEEAAGSGDLDAVVSGMDGLSVRWDRARTELIAARDAAR